MFVSNGSFRNVLAGWSENLPLTLSNILYNKTCFFPLHLTDLDMFRARTGQGVQAKLLELLVAASGCIIYRYPV